MRNARRAVEGSPKQSRHLALDTLAWAQFRKGDTASAIATQKEAIGLLPPGFSLDRMVLEKSLKAFQEGGATGSARN